MCSSYHFMIYPCPPYPMSLKNSLEMLQPISLKPKSYDSTWMEAHEYVFQVESSREFPDFFECIPIISSIVGILAAPLIDADFAAALDLSGSIFIFC